MSISSLAKSRLSLNNKGSRGRCALKWEGGLLQSSLSLWLTLLRLPLSQEAAWECDRGTEPSARTWVQDPIQPSDPVLLTWIRLSPVSNDTCPAAVIPDPGAARPGISKMEKAAVGGLLLRAGERKLRRAWHPWLARQWLGAGHLSGKQHCLVWMGWHGRLRACELLTFFSGPTWHDWETT